MAAPAQLIGGNEAQRTEEEQRFAVLHIPLLFTAVGSTPKKKKKKITRTGRGVSQIRARLWVQKVAFKAISQRVGLSK